MSHLSVTLSNERHDKLSSGEIMDKYQIAWALLFTFGVFVIAYSMGFKDGQREGFVRGRIAGRKAVQR
jgi:hypothetical protein